MLWLRTLMQPHQLLLPLFSCFISNTDCELVYSNFLIDEIDMTIPISFCPNLPMVYMICTRW
jgi:hypothetical protein